MKSYSNPLIANIEKRQSVLNQLYKDHKSEDFQSLVEKQIRDYQELLKK